MPIEIAFADAYIPLASARDGEPDRAPLSALDGDRHSHVHGTLRIRIDGAELPALGYFGPDDACLGAWVHELEAAAHALMHADPASHVFDEGEQGQPAFVFEREGDQVRVSLRSSELDPDIPPPDWPSQACRLDEFVAAVRDFRGALAAAVLAASPFGERWLAARRA